MDVVESRDKKCAYRDPVCLSGLVPVFFFDLGAMAFLLWLIVKIFFLEPLELFLLGLSFSIAFILPLFFVSLEYMTSLILAVYYKLPFADVKPRYFTMHEGQYSHPWSLCLIAGLIILLLDFIYYIAVYGPPLITLNFWTLIQILSIIVFALFIAWDEGRLVTRIMHGLYNTFIHIIQTPALVPIFRVLVKLIQYSITLFLLPFVVILFLPLYVSKISMYLYQRACMWSCRSNDSLINILYGKKILSLSPVKPGEYFRQLCMREETQ